MDIYKFTHCCDLSSHLVKHKRNSVYKVVLLVIIEYHQYKSRIEVLICLNIFKKNTILTVIKLLN
jgi:hypothetical protein